LGYLNHEYSDIWFLASCSFVDLLILTSII